MMHRRRFLKTTCLGTLGAGVSLLSAAPAKEFRPRYVVASSMFGTMKLADILPEVHKCGAEEIDIWPKIHGDQREQIEEMGHERFAELLAKHKVKVGLITQFHLGALKLQPEMPIVKKFGGWLLVTGGRGPRGVTGAELKAAIKKFAEEMKPHIEAAEKHGVSIAIENHSGGVMATADSIRWLIDFSPSRNFGLALAPYHLPQDPELIASLIEHAGEKLFLFYAWQHGKGSAGALPKPDQIYQMPGRGGMDFTPAMRALKKINYRHYTEIFMHPSPRGTAAGDKPSDVTDAINFSRTYLEDCIKKA